MVLITGEVGAGKTFLGNMLGTKLGMGCLTIVMQHPPQSGKQLLRALSSRIGMSVRSSSDKLTLVDSLEQHLIRLHTRGRLIALILDEAQDLSAACLEEIRLLWNWEQDGQRLIQILLISQPELREKLLDPKWEPLRQRIVLSYHLGHLSLDDTAAYISHRIRVAADEGCTAEFAPDTIKDIYAATGGTPRLINVLCDNALLVGYAKGAARITRHIIAEVLRDMTCWGLRVSEPPPSGTPAISI